MKYLAILLLFVSCSTINNDVLKTSLEVNQVSLMAYQDVSSALKYLVEDIIYQLSQQGKDVSGLSHYLDVIKENDKNVLKVCQELKNRVQLGILDDKNYEQFIINFLSGMILLYEGQK